MRKPGPQSVWSKPHTYRRRRGPAFPWHSATPGMYRPHRRPALREERCKREGLRRENLRVRGKIPGLRPGYALPRPGGDSGAHRVGGGGCVVSDMYHRLQTASSGHAAMVATPSLELGRVWSQSSEDCSLQRFICLRQSTTWRGALQWILHRGSTRRLVETRPTVRLLPPTREWMRLTKGCD